MPAIGIDLGTTYSCVAVYHEGEVKIIDNEVGKPTTPSWVAFTDVDRIIGFAAKNQVSQNPENTVYGVKRLIGRHYTDSTVTSDREKWPFEVISVDGKPTICVQYKNERKLFPAEEISSMILGSMKRTAERLLGENKVTDAVITVPAYFDNSQRQATKDAGTIAGLNVLRVLNEPTAAAIAYGINNKIVNKRNILIYDLGGGTFDVAVVTIDKGNVNVLATAGDTHLGGEDFDNQMLDHFVTVFKNKHKINIRDDPKDIFKARAVSRLRAQCENMKCALSNSLQAGVVIDCLYKDSDLQMKMTRARFEELNGTLFESTLKHVEQCLEDAGMNRKEIDDVVLVGGSTRIPKVQELLQDFFNGKELTKSINQDEAVAYGAAVMAAVLGDDTPDIFKNVHITDVIPLTLGVAGQKDVMSVVIKRNTPIPTKQTKIYGTVEDNQSEISFPIREGECTKASGNVLLDTITLSDIKPAKSGEVKFLVTFDIDADSIIHVSAVESNTGIQKKIKLANYKGLLSKHEIDRKIIEARRFNEDDEKHRKRAAAKNKLDKYVNNIKSTMKKSEVKNKLSESDRSMVMRKCSDTETWLDENPSVNEAEIHQRQKALQSICDPIIRKLS